MPVFSRFKDKIRRRGKSPATQPGQDNAPRLPSVPSGNLSVPAVVARQDSTEPDVAAESISTPERVNESLWERAYKALDPEMVAEYDAVVAEVVKEQDSMTGSKSETAIEVRVDEISQQGKTAYEAKKLQYSMFNKTLVASKLVGDAVSLIKRFKPIIDEAVKASAAASFAWVGVSLALGILANPQDVHEENLNGLAQVTSKMHYYTAIEPLLLQKKRNQGIDAGIYGEVEKLVVDLYTNILDFECRSALRFYCPRLRRVWKDTRRADDWTGLLSKIGTSEETLKARNALITAENQLEAAERAASILSDSRQQLEAQTEILRDMLDLEKKKELIEKVPLVPGALYSSYEDRATPQCQQDTRVATLAEIDDWIQTPDTRGVFWLSGPAGSGKSTISKTVAASLDERGLLAASYFFRAPDRRMADKVFSTISRQLVDRVPGFDAALYQTLQSDTTPVSKLLHSLQCKMLIADPLSSLGDSRTKSMVVVVDGLDECESDIEVLCNLLCGLPEVVAGRLLVFLASRDVRSIKDTILARDHRKYIHLNLLGKTEESVSDITAFVREEFNKMAKKRRNSAAFNNDEIVSRVIALCTTPSPLFVFASTLCRSVSRNTSPSYQLKKWLDAHKNTAPESRLDELYASVIRQALFDEEGGTRYDESQRKDLLTVIGSLMFLSQPLSSSSLATLLDMDLDSVNDMLDDFRPVLNIPANDNEPIQILHTSFVEFMRGHKVSDLQDFLANEQVVHSTLLRRCIAYMRESLKQDVCELNHPATHRDSVNQSVLDAHIPAALQYACVFWSRHMTQSDENASQAVFDFLKDHLLHWIEVVALLRRVIDATSAMQELATWTAGELQQFLDDTVAFLQAYGISIIEEHPLQVYGGALVWCPTSNMVRSTQWKHRLPVIESAISSTNDIKLRPSPMEGHTDVIADVAFSPRCDIVASSSWDGSVRFWDTKTRQCKDILQASETSTESLAYSYDGETLATASDCISLWSTPDHKLKLSISLDSRTPYHVAFIPKTDKIAAYMSDYTMRVWNYKTGEAFERHGTIWNQASETRKSPSPHVLVISPDGRLLAASVDKRLLLFDAETLSVLHIWECDTSIYCVAFTSDGQTVMAGMRTGGIRAWYTTSYLSSFEVLLEMNHCGFSNDGQLFAMSRRDIVSVYAINDLKTAAYLEDVKPVLVHSVGEQNALQNGGGMFFSPYSNQLIIAGAFDLTLLDLTRSTVAEVENGEEVRAIQYSRDQQAFLVMGPVSISVWDIANCQRRFVTPRDKRIPSMHHEDWFKCMDLSPDGRYLATGGSTEIQIFPLPQAEAVCATDGSAADDGPIELFADSEIDRAADHIDDEASDPGFFIEHPEDFSPGSFISAMAFSADSQSLAVGCNDGIIRIWDVTTWTHTSTRREASMLGHFVVHLAFSNDSLLLCACYRTGGDDNVTLVVYEARKDGLSPTKFVEDVFWPGGRYVEFLAALFDIEKGVLINTAKSRPRLRGTVRLRETVLRRDRWVSRDGVRLLQVPTVGQNCGYVGPLSGGTTDRIVLPFVRGGVVVVTLVPSP